jgi:rubredoxin
MTAHTKPEKNYECSLCGLEFDGASCHGSCPMSRGCEMVRCPRCGYEFVQDGFVAGLFRKLLKRGKPAARNTEHTRPS